MKTNFINQKMLPLLVEPDERVENRSDDGQIFRLSLERDDIRDKLLEHGALLLRGFPALDPPAFAEFVRRFSGRTPLSYAGGASPRTNLGDAVYTSTEYPGHYTLSLHNEMSYTSRWPRHLFFYCAVAPEQGGETPLADSRRVLKRIDAKVVEEFKSRKIKYVRNLHGGSGTGYSWQEAFETEDRTVVENLCREACINWTWRADGGVRLTEVRPATAVHPLTGEEVWFNQAEGFHPSASADAELSTTLREDELRLNAFYGDGGSLSLPALEHIREVTRAEAAFFPWRAGDILIVDNMLACHGRMPFTGARKVLLAMT
ncbi:MAG TPA: TauD/TfdA family dioxygenase [Pyrinomonadaceae bacterium]|nr:TauD/TfdA family dioxygenase [Pyrinomonadaceae bacterium]